MRKLLYSLSFAVLLSLAFSSGFMTNASALSTITTGNQTTAELPSVLVKPVQGPSVTSQLKDRAKISWPWYITRAAGFVAAFSLVLLIFSGIGFMTGATFRFLEPLTAWATHKAIAYVFAISVIIHVGALLFDKYVPFTIAQALVPFISHYREVTIAGHHLGSLYVALGIFALYFVLAIILTSILWMDKKPRTWKLFHFLGYLTMIFVFFHALYLGTDLMHGVFRVLWIVIGIGVAVAIVYRVRRRASIE